MGSSIDRNSLRLAVETDLPELLRWRNDEITRRFRNDDRLVQPDEHRAWFARRQASDSKIYIFEFDSIPRGNITLDVDEHGTEVGWIVAPEHRNKGLAKAMVVASIPKCPTKPIWAKTRVDNIASVHVALGSGFERDFERDEGEMIYFKLHSMQKS
jgi:RimJ/RimL family protein N-acetyltransferase